MQAQQLPLTLEPSPHFHQEDLVISQANETAFATLQAWPDWRVPTTVLIGAPGSGKSHMAACWATKAGARSFKPNALECALPQLVNGHPLLIEDIGPAMFDETALFHLLNGVTQTRLTRRLTGLLITSRFHPSEWNIRLADLDSRLKAIQLVEIAPPDDLLLAAVLTKLFADRQLIIEPHLITYCVSRMERSFDAARQFVANVDRLALEKKSKITRGLVGQALANS